MLNVSQCIEAMGNGCLTEEHIKELVRILNKILTEHFNRYAARQGQSALQVTGCSFQWCCSASDVHSRHLFNFASKVFLLSVHISQSSYCETDGCCMCLLDSHTYKSTIHDTRTQHLFLPGTCTFSPHTLVSPLPHVVCFSFSPHTLVSPLPHVVCFSFSPHTLVSPLPHVVCFSFIHASGTLLTNTRTPLKMFLMKTKSVYSCDIWPLNFASMLTVSKEIY